MRHARGEAPDDVQLARMQELLLQAFPDLQFLVERDTLVVGLAQALSQCAGGVVQDEGDDQVRQQQGRAVAKHVGRPLCVVPGVVIGMQAHGHHHRDAGVGAPERSPSQNQAGHHQHKQ